jgi:hypothetical protein
VLGVAYATRPPAEGAVAFEELTLSHNVDQLKMQTAGFFAPYVSQPRAALQFA